VAIGLLSLVLVFGLAGSVDVAKAAANPVVKAISVEGAKNIPPDVVMPVIKATKIGEEVTEDAVKKDLESIMALGYFFDLKARFVPQDGGVKVVFEVVENPKVKDITFIGDTSIPESVLKEAVGLETGQILNSNKLNEGLRRMLDKAANEYGVPLRVSDIAFADDGVVKVKLTATRLGDIKIDGNQKTKDWVIRREMSLRPGEPLNLKNLRKDLRNVLNLGFFDEVGQQFTQTKDPDVSDLTIQVKERKTGSAAGGVAYSSADGLVGYIELADDNFYGRGQRVNLKWEFGASKNTYNLGFYEPYLDDKHTSLGVNLYNEDRSTTQGGIKYTDHKTGGDVSVGRPFGEDTRGYLKFTASDNQRKQDGISTPITSGRINSLTATAVNDTRDFVLSPSTGGRRDFSVEWADKMLGGDYNFTKYSTDLSQYFKAGRSGQVVALHLGAGYLGYPSDDPAHTPSFEQFTVGGADTVRGYLDREFAGDKMLVLNAEYRFKLSKGLTGVVFADAGDAWAKEDKVTLDNLKTGYGVGLRVDTPVGVMRIDYGIGKDGGHKTYFSLGQTF
jgi:outer membrane protein insertion porin family